MDSKSNNFKMMEYEIHIEEIIRHHQFGYRYRGQPGKEFGVIQSIFQELNLIPVLSNKHIRWYTSIISLSGHYRMYQEHLPLIDTLHLSATGPSPHHQAGYPKESPASIDYPDFIESLEACLKSIAGLGILISSKMEIHEPYLHHRHHRMAGLLTGLLNHLKSFDLSPPEMDIYLLSIRNSTENMLKLSRNKAGKSPGELMKILKSQPYRQLVTNRTEEIPGPRRRSLFNLDDFWNGLIP